MTTLLVSSDGPVRVLTLDRPQKRNALNTQLMAELVQAIRDAGRDESIGAALIVGNGPVFCAGADLKEFMGGSDTDAGAERRLDLMEELQRVFLEVDVPVVSAVTGAALGGGANIAVASDYTVFGESARLGFPEVPLGMVPSLMVPHLMARAGYRRAFELLSFGQQISASEALEAGLANAVVPDAEVLPAAMAAARSLAALPRGPMRQMKRLLVRTADMPFEEALSMGRRCPRSLAPARDPLRVEK
jgi:enoyl-CoA hydratase/carnithine racemase